MSWAARPEEGNVSCGANNVEPPFGLGRACVAVVVVLLLLLLGRPWDILPGALSMHSVFRSLHLGCRSEH